MVTDKLLKKRHLILHGSLIKAILLLAIPIALNDFIRASYNLIDAYFVAQIGSTEVAAITFVSPINMMVRTISVGLSVGGTTLIAREIGRSSYEKAKNIGVELILISMIVGCFIAGWGFFYSTEILLKASATKGLLNAADLYFKITVLSAPFIFFNSAYVAIKSAQGAAGKTLQVNSMGILIKIVLAYIFIIKMDMGIKGLAYSTIVGTMAVSMYGFYDLFLSNKSINLTFKGFSFSKSVFKALLLISIPIIIEKSSVSFSFILMNKYVLVYGENVLAAYGITNRVNGMFFATVTGFGIGIAPIISQNLGAKNSVRARQAIKIAYLTALLIAGTVIAIFMPFRTIIAQQFTGNDSEVLYHTVNAMSVFSVSVIPWAVFQVTNGVFQGTGNTKFNMLLSLVRIYVFRIPIVLLLMHFFEMDEYSIWYGMLLSNILTGMFSFGIYLLNKNDLRLVGD